MPFPVRTDPIATQSIRPAKLALSVSAGDRRMLKIQTRLDVAENHLTPITAAQLRRKQLDVLLAAVLEIHPRR
jgi:hypothetical protein